VVHKEGNIKLEPEGRDDMISVTYNLRNEIYGEVKEGASFNITTEYKDKSPNFNANVRSAEDSDELSKWKDLFPDIKYVVDVALDPEALDSKEGKLVVLLTEDLTPVGGFVWCPGGRGQLEIEKTLIGVSIMPEDRRALRGILVLDESKGKFLSFERIPILDSLRK